MKKVFISSTSRDLIKFRQAVEKVILRLEMFPIGMENFNSDTNSSLQLCYNKVLEADIFIGIYAHRYGYVPMNLSYTKSDSTPASVDNRTSITHYEYLWAVERGIPILLFVLADKDENGNALEWDEEFIDKEPDRSRLLSFKAVIMRNHVVNFFHSPDNLALLISTAILEQEQAKSTLLTNETHHRRQRLIEKTHAIWVEDYLTPRRKAEIIPIVVNKKMIVSSHADWSNRQEESQSHIGTIIDIPSMVVESLSQKTLILGDRGSGKTITLALITEYLLQKATPTNDAPIPILLNLSKWSEERHPIEKWVSEEIHDLYHVLKSVVPEFIRQRQIVLLFDSLDEVKPAYRAECVTAINTFFKQETYENAFVIISCRNEAYETIGKTLSIDRTLQLQPLTHQQIVNFIAARCANPQPLLELIESNHKLRDIIRSPLMLEILVSIYGENQDISTLYTTGDSQTIETYLFDKYVQKTLNRHTLAYEEKDIKNWISWIAGRLYDENQTHFILDRLQPTWITNPSIRRSYTVFSTLIIYMMIGLPTCISMAHLLAPNLGLGVGYLVGCAYGVTLPLIIDIATKRNINPKNSILVSGAITITLIATLIHIFTIPVAFLVSGITGIAIYIIALKFGNKIVTQLGAPSDLASKEEVLHEHQKSIYVIEKLGWIWGNAFLGMILAFVIISIFTLCALALSGGTNKDVIMALFSFLVPYGISLAFGGGVMGVEVEDITWSNVANRGILTSLLNFIRVALVAGGISVVISLILLLSGSFTYSPLISLIIGLGVGMAVGMQFGGSAVIKHAVLRLLLVMNQVIPVHYAHFLDFAKDIGFLKKIGRQYEFYHLELRDYFAKQLMKK